MRRCDVPSSKCSSSFAVVQCTFIFVDSDSTARFKASFFSWLQWLLAKVKVQLYMS